MKPMSRKRLTVDVVKRLQITFRLGQEVVDRQRAVLGVVVALTDEGCLLRRKIWKDDCSHTERWFVHYHDARPWGDGRRYA